MRKIVCQRTSRRGWFFHRSFPSSSPRGAHALQKISGERSDPHQTSARRKKTASFSSARIQKSDASLFNFGRQTNPDNVDFLPHDRVTNRGRVTSGFPVARLIGGYSFDLGGPLGVWPGLGPRTPLGIPRRRRVDRLVCPSRRPARAATAEGWSLRYLREV